MPTTRPHASRILAVASVTLVMHAFWAAPPDQAPMQQVNFMKNLAVMGGLLAFYALGPGRFSVDGRLRRPMQP